MTASFQFYSSEPILQDHGNFTFCQKTMYGRKLRALQIPATYILRLRPYKNAVLENEYGRALYKSALGPIKPDTEFFQPGGDFVPATVA